MATRDEIEALTLEIRTLVAMGRVTFVPVGSHAQDLATLGITASEAEAILRRLKVCHYVKGAADEEEGESNLWTFGFLFERRRACVQLQIETGRKGRLVRCVSFCPTRKNLCFPFTLLNSD